jgi:hypothetical protein
VTALRRLAAALGTAWARLRARGAEPYETDVEFIASVAHLLPPAALADKPSACPDCGGPRTDLGPDGTGHRVAQCGRCGGIFDLTAAARPEWLYGSGCCDQWTPADGCRWHTGRPAMSLAARELGSESESAAARRLHDARAVQLDRMARHRLAAIIREHGGTWVMGGPETWTKDELVAEILSAEFPPEETR